MSYEPDTEISMRRRTIALALVATSFVFAACGGSDHDDMNADSSADTATGAAGSDSEGAGSPNAADVMFVQGIIPHHEQAVEMAELALDSDTGASAAVSDLAARIRDAQDPEIQTMRGWLEAWGEPEMGMSGGDHGGMDGMDGMMSEDELAELEELTGEDFDRAWTEMMTRHHQGAIEMAESVKGDGDLAEVKSLADAIITAQQQEIDEMQTLLEGAGA